MDGNTKEKTARGEVGGAGALEPSDAPVPSTKKPLSFHLSFLALSIMVFVVSLDATMLSVALPVIASDLKSTTFESFWASNGFLLAVVVTQPLYTSTSDVLGRSIPLYTSFILFIVGCVVFAVAPTPSVLILGRILQGLGGGGIDILGEIIVADMTTMKERPLYLGLLGIPMSAGSVLGPFLGGVLSQYASWRWLGWLNVPITAIGLVLVIFFLRLRPIQASFLQKLRRLDWIGMLLFFVGCTAFVLPLSWAGALYPWGSWQTLVPLLVGAVVLAVFGWYESRPEEPVMPHRLFGSVTAAVTLVGTFVHGMAVYCLLLYLPLFFEAALLQTPLQAVITLLPLSISVVGFSCLSAVAIDYIRSYRYNIWLGWVLTTVGIGLLTLLQPRSPASIRISSQIVAGIGIGILNCILVIPMQASVLDVNDTGLAVGLQVFARLFGALVGIAVGSTIFQSTFTVAIEKLGDIPDSLSAVKDVSKAIEFIPSLRSLNIAPELLDSVLGVYTQSIRTICYALLGFAAFASLLSVLTKDQSLEKDEMGRQRFEQSD